MDQLVATVGRGVKQPVGRLVEIDSPVEGLYKLIESHGGREAWWTTARFHDNHRCLDGWLQTFSISIDSVPETFLSTTGGFGPISSSFGSTKGTVKVTYEFEESVIPEPASLAIWSVIGGIGLIAGYRKRRRKTAA